MASRDKVSQALEAIVGTLNVVASRYLDSTSFFDPIGQDGGAKALLFAIDDGLSASVARRDRFKRGIASPEDMIPRDI